MFCWKINALRIAKDIFLFMQYLQKKKKKKSSREKSHLHYYSKIFMICSKNLVNLNNNNDKYVKINKFKKSINSILNMYYLLFI